MKPSAITEDLKNTIRTQVKDTKKLLEENKRDRLFLASEIALTKLELKVDERNHSMAQLNDEEKVDELYSIIRTRQNYLLKLRQTLVSAEIYREITAARFRVLNKQIDKFNIVFDPEAKRQKTKVKQ